MKRTGWPGKKLQEMKKLTITKEDVGISEWKDPSIQAKDGGEMVVSSIRRGYGNPSYAGIRWIFMPHQKGL